MTTKPKAKRDAGRGWQDILMPSKPLIHYVSPLSPQEIIAILTSFSARDPVNAKVETIETAAGTLYKFYIYQRYTIQSRYPKRSLKTPLGDGPFSREGEKGYNLALVGLLKATASNQSLLTFDQGPQVVGCVVIVLAVVLLIATLVSSFTLAVKGLIGVLLFLMVVLAYLVLPIVLRGDEGLGLVLMPGDHVGDLMTKRLQIKRLVNTPPPRS